MSISFSSATGNLFNRIGKLGLLVKQVKSYQTSQLTNMTDTATGVVAQFNGESDIQALMGSAYISELDGAGSLVGGVAQSIAEQTVNRMVFRDNPRISQDLQSLNTVASIQEVIRQMKLASASVLAMTIGATPAAVVGTGNGIAVASTKRPLDGLVLENSFAETMLITCTSDSYVGGATAGNEGFQVTGTGDQSNFFAFNWPLGSNASVALNAIDGETNNGSGNLLNNSGFETFTVANTPDNWTISVGTAGTNIFKESSLIYSGSAALKLASDGSTLFSIKQTLNSSTGSISTLSSQTQYSFNVFMRYSGVAPLAGTMLVELIDGSGNVINDVNNVANSLSFNLTTLTTSYAAFNGVFRTPVVLPSTYALRIRLSVAATNGSNIYIDKASLGAMTQAYTSGPFVSVHSGSTPFIENDFFTVAVTNSRGSGSTLSTFQTLWAQLFPDMITSELLLPSSGANTISDSLIS